MALFNRNKNQTISDLENYYANRNNRTGMAWLMAFVSLVATIGILAAIFFGGRWVYRSLKSEDRSSELSTTLEEPESQSTPGATNSGGDQVEPEGVVSDEAATTETPSVNNNQSSDEETSSDNTTTQEGDIEDIPTTGASDIMLIAPLIVGILSYLYSIKRQQQ